MKRRRFASLTKTHTAAGPRALAVLAVAVSLLLTSGAEQARALGKKGQDAVQTKPSPCLGEAEMELARLINEYRSSLGLAPVPVSASLTAVAKAHVYDLATHGPSQGKDKRGRACSLHSWSAKGEGQWEPVCYTRDHAYADKMWNKPRELTRNAYKGNGFENAYWNSNGATPERAMMGWMKSPSHNAVIAEQGLWRDSSWPVMGVAIFEQFAVVWFGDQPDPLGPVAQCDFRNPPTGEGTAGLDTGVEREVVASGIVPKEATVIRESP